MAVNTQATALQVSDMASPEVYTTVAGVTNVSGPSGSRAVIDKTTLADTARQKEVGIADYGQYTFDLVFDRDEATNVTLDTLFASGASNNFKLVVGGESPNDVYSFAGFVLNLSKTFQIDDVVRASVTIEIDGSVTAA